jgi:hypothetical protein
MSFRDVLSPALKGDPRVKSDANEIRRVFKNTMYDVYLYVFAGGLVAGLVVFKQEALRVMVKVSEREDLQTAVDRLQREGRGPMNLVLDAKLETGLQLSLHDRAALKIAGVAVPKSAGRYRDMFEEK